MGKRVALWGVWLLASTAGAQNLLSNPDFDADLLGWGNATAPWTHALTGWPLGTSTSGSARVINTASIATAGNYIDQCVPVSSEHRYLMSFYGLVPIGQARTGSVRAYLYFYDDANCSVNSHYIGTLPMVTTPGLDWQQAGLSATATVGAQSARLELAVWKDQAGGAFEAGLDGVYFGPAISGDFNSDGRADLVLESSSTNQHRLWRMARNLRAADDLVTPDPDSADWKLVATGNFNAGNLADLVFRNQVTGDMQFWLMNGATRTDVLALGGGTAPPPNWTLTAAADFNYDTAPDLVWRNETSQKLVIWTMLGANKTGAIVPSPDHAADSNWRCVAALDVDRNNTTDLLWYNETTGKIVVWYMDPWVVRVSGAFTTPANAGDSNWKVVAAGHYAQLPTPALDSVDLVWRNQMSGKQVIWYMDKTGTRVGGVLTSPDSESPALEWNVVGPR